MCYLFVLVVADLRPNVLILAPKSYPIRGNGESPVGKGYMSGIIFSGDIGCNKLSSHRVCL